MAVGDIGLDRIRVIGFHGLIDQVRQAGPAVEVLVAPADAVGPLFRGLGNQVDQLLQALAADVAGFVGQRQAALGADRAQQGVDDVNRAADVKRVHVARRSSSPGAR